MLDALLTWWNRPTRGLPGIALPILLVVGTIVVLVLTFGSPAHGAEYPDGGTSPTSFPAEPAAQEAPHPRTGTDWTGLLTAGGVVAIVFGLSLVLLTVAARRFPEDETTLDFP